MPPSPTSFPEPAAPSSSRDATVPPATRHEHPDRDPGVAGDSSPCDGEAARIVARLTFAEKAALLSGHDTWHFGGVPRLGIPPLRVADCGHGVTFVEEGLAGTTCLPTAIGMGATWDPGLVERAGALLGRECRALGVGILLGPMINLIRLPVGGRNFEAWSEDPHHTARLATAFIHGIQSTGTGACAKHLAGYAQTRHSRTHSAEIDPRTLRELYLRHFAAVIREARPALVMTAYNKVNGHDTAAHRGLLQDFLRHELHYEGVTLSDWGGVHDTAVIAAGLDLEMPGPPRHVTSATLAAAIACGDLTHEELDARATRILAASLRHAVRPGQPGELDTPAHRALAREVAESSIVLLKNENAALPLEVPLRRLAVIGPNAATARLGGSGSASVTPSHAVSPLEGLRARLAGTGIEIGYAEGCPAHGSGKPVAGRFAVSFFNNIDLEGPPAHRTTADTIACSWGWAAPAPGVRRGEFGVRIEGVLDYPVSGGTPPPPSSLILHYESGGARVWIDDRLVHDHWTPDACGTFEDRYGAHSASLRVWSSGSGVHSSGNATLTSSATPANNPERETLNAKPAAEVDAQPRSARLRIDFRQLASGSALRLEWPPDNDTALRDEAVALARDADAVILCAGLCNRFEGGGSDRPSLALPEGQDALIAAIAAVNPRTVVVLNGATAMAMPWLDRVPAVLHAFYPGEEGGAALARILCGDVSPSGRLPVTLPRRLEDVPGMAFYPGTPGRVLFGEGLFVGYRHDVSHPGLAAPLFPFGHGLTYSTFDYSGLSLQAAGGGTTVALTLTNTGLRAAAEVVQLYVGPAAPDPDVPRPALELRAFRKIRLAPGESRRVSFMLTSDDLARYDPGLRRWLVEPGDYRVQVGPNSAEGLTATFPASWQDGAGEVPAIGPEAGVWQKEPAPPYFRRSINSTS
ncbi:beta-glucosidase-like glycosyl hydrolase [Opitutaceae bacterium TAV1]|nr:beta-glucosidase-like glycosyl hydrolase [Opitutaceae bacterium TAV1]